MSFHAVSPRWLIALALMAAVSSPAMACLWDTDTLQMERKRFPGTYELITGKFVRHSRAYYEWRVKDRQGKLLATPDDPALIDDLAVAYDKLGRQAEGIALLEACLADNPDRYETIANLGTLYIHAGQFDRGAELIAKAIEVNPDAHFGREKYQLLLVKYAQQSETLKTEGIVSNDSRWSKGRAIGFAKYVLAQQNLPEFTPERPAVEVELEKAHTGILGILHFGNFESPVVLEALGDLLLRSGEGKQDARLLAARAFLKAAAHSKNEAAIAAYESMAHDSLIANEDYHATNDQTKRETLDKVELELGRDLKKAKEWFQQIVADEAAWIEAGMDVDREFAAKYYDSLEATIDNAAMEVAKEPLDERDDDYGGRRGRRTLLILAGFIALLIAGSYGVYAGTRAIWRKIAGGKASH